MRRNRIAIALCAAGSLVLVGCTGVGSGDEGARPDTSRAAIVTTNGSEPASPLMPSATDESGGGRILDAIFAGLIAYESDGSPVNDMAAEIRVEDAQNLTIVLKEGQYFTDGEEVRADNFINAWNYGALLSNEQYSSSFFEDIEGFSYETDSKLTGLEQVDDYTFTIALNKPASDFALRLGHSAYYPLPDVAFEDMAAFGENPVGNGPYMLDGAHAWQHDVGIDLVKNEEYQGVRQAQNGGLSITFYTTPDAAYADLLGGRVDVIDVIPVSALSSFQSDLGERAVDQPAAALESFTIPQNLPHFTGEEGRLRRQALSMAIDREEITRTMFHGTRTPATDFTSPVIDGWSGSLGGADVLGHDPGVAVDLWAQADAISPWAGTFQIAYNADGGHAQWVDAVTESIVDTLGIEASGDPYATFAVLGGLVHARTLDSAFRTGWQADYPSVRSFLQPLYATHAGSNGGGYSNPEFDSLISEATSSMDPQEAAERFQRAQEILLRDLPSIPLWYSNATGGYAETVENVEFGWNSVPVFHEITKGE